MKTPWLLTASGVLAVLALVGAGCGTTETTTEETADHSEMSETEVVADTAELNEVSSGETTSSVEVSIDRTAFTPADITIKKGDTITWTNTDFIGHTVTSRELDDDHSEAEAHGHDEEDLVLDSPLLANGETFSYTFDEVGEFPYHCHPHPHKTGTVTVTE